jgi:hypothetical protein
LWGAEWRVLSGEWRVFRGRLVRPRFTCGHVQEALASPW